MADEGASYDVGFGKPPKGSQFRSGQSGNPKGRPKGAKNFATVINEELRVRIDVTENGRRKKISKRQAIAKQLVNKAASGDPKAIPILLNEEKFRESGASSGMPQNFITAEEDQRVMENMLRRIRQVGSPPTEPEPASEQPAEPEAPSSLESATGDS